MIKATRVAKVTAEVAKIAEVTTEATKVASTAQAMTSVAEKVKKFKYPVKVSRLPESLGNSLPLQIIKTPEGFKMKVPDAGKMELGAMKPSTAMQEGASVGKMEGKIEGLGNFKYKKISETPSEDVNKWWKEEMGYSEPPYKPGVPAQEIELTEKSTFVRVYDGENSGMYGGWFMKADDIKGLTPSQIQDKFALPTTPKFIADVELDVGTRIRTGTANRLFGFEGGGQQFDLMGQRVGRFTNPRSLP